MSDEEKPGLIPNKSTGVQVVGGVIATTFIVICDKAFDLQFPAGYEVGLGITISLAISYFHESGRR